MPDIESVIVPRRRPDIIIVEKFIDQGRIDDPHPRT